MSLCARCFFFFSHVTTFVFKIYFRYLSAKLKKVFYLYFRVNAVLLYKVCFWKVPVYNLAVFSADVCQCAGTQHLYKTINHRQQQRKLITSLHGTFFLSLNIAVLALTKGSLGVRDSQKLPWNFQKSMPVSLGLPTF